LETTALNGSFDENVPKPSAPKGFPNYFSRTTSGYAKFLQMVREQLKIK